LKDKGKSEKRENDLAERTFKFAVSTIKLLKSIKYSKENEVIRYQLAKSATSIGSNYEEAQGAYSKDDFKYKISICLREVRESNYWLRIIKETDILNSAELSVMVEESIELKKIFSSIMKKIHKRDEF